MLCLVVILLVSVYGAVEFVYQKDISAMRNSIEKAKSEVLGSKNGIEKSSPTVTHGSNLFGKLGCTDANCPQVEATWQVALTNEEVSQFKSDATTAIKGGHDNWRVSVFVAPTESQDAAPSGKTWQSVYIFVYE
jgi:hypothetical protein